jgi:hypothetical protein
MIVGGIGGRRSAHSLGPFVGRNRELADLTTALDAVAADGSGAELIDGPAGIGKSRLLDEVAAMASKRGFTVLSARASTSEQGFAFGVAGQLLEPVLLTAKAAQRKELFTGSAVLAQRVLDWDALRGGTAERPLDTFAALNGLYRLVVNLAAEGPVRMAVDDVARAENLVHAGQSPTRGVGPVSFPLRNITAR